jgi:cell shape-determining protein MreC
MGPAEVSRLKARREQIKEIMRWVDDPEELAFLDLEKKQINEELKGFDEEATELSAMFKVSVTDARHD